jgi:phosphatidate cytidylyltransferase
LFWKRALTAAILVPVTVGVVLYAPLWLLSGLVGVVILLSLWEFFRMGEQVGFSGFVQWTTLCALLVVFVQWREAAVAARRMADGWMLTPPATVPGGLEAILVLYIVGLGILASFTRLEVKQRLGALVESAGGLLLVALPVSYLVRIAGFSSGRRFLLLILVLMWVGDTSAYFVGKSLGRLPMAPVLSPKKTWEGAAANLLGSVVAGVVAARWLPLPAVSVLILAVLANVAGQAGDLLESAYKRSAGVKDSGQLLPGHGGMLDRIDSLALAAPVAWWYLTLLTTTGHLR